MVDRHDIDQFASNALGILLLNELSEDALEIGEREGGLEFGRRRVGQDFSLCDNDDAMADEFDDLKDVGDVEDCLCPALRGAATDL